MNCDFCYAENPEYWNKVSPEFALEVKKDGVLSRLFITFDGNWAACAECQEFINKGDQEGLTKRALELERIQPTDPAASIVAQLHQLFMRYRLNIEAIEIGKENWG